MLDIESLPPDWRAALSRIPTEVLLALAKQPAQHFPSDLLTRKEAAHFLRVSVSFLNKLHAAGTGPKFIHLGHKDSGPVRYRRADLEAWRDRDGAR